jgi:hypothetical protein
MRVLLTQKPSGTRDGLDWPEAGTEIDLPEAEARSLISGGVAVEPGKGSSKTVLVPPMGIHTPGRTAMPPGEDGPPLVEVPADAVSDPEGVKAALKARAEGNFVAGPANVAHQDSTGRALTKDELDDAAKAEKATRAALYVDAPKVGQDASGAPAGNVTPAEPKAPSKASEPGKGGK